MIRVKKITVKNIPLIELVLEEKDNERLPTVVFYHGWTSTKEAVLVNGYELAKKGIRAVLPEAYLHGERDKSGNGTKNNQFFWEVVLHNINEIPLIYDYYTREGYSDSNRFGVSGISMGGITCCALLKQYDWIKSSFVLMGSPSPIEFTKWLIQSKWTLNPSENEMPNKDQVHSAIEKLYEIDLNMHPEKISYRPVHFWHGTKDDAVPFHLTEKFIEKISLHPYAKNVSLFAGHGHGHKVPYTVSVKMADFFENNL